MANFTQSVVHINIKKADKLVNSEMKSLSLDRPIQEKLTCWSVFHGMKVKTDQGSVFTVFHTTQFLIEFIYTKWPDWGVLQQQKYLKHYVLYWTINWIHCSLNICPKNAAIDLLLPFCSWREEGLSGLNMILHSCLSLSLTNHTFFFDPFPETEIPARCNRVFKGSDRK